MRIGKYSQRIYPSDYNFKQCPECCGIITEEQAKKEGCIEYQDKIGNGKFEDVIEFDLTARDAFGELWNSTVDKNQIQQYGWNANPYVWVIEFERCEKPEATT